MFMLVVKTLKNDTMEQNPKKYLNFMQVIRNLPFNEVK